MNFLHYKIIGAPKKFKHQPRPLLRSSSLKLVKILEIYRIRISHIEYNKQVNLLLSCHVEKNNRKLSEFQFFSFCATENYMVSNTKKMNARYMNVKWNDFRE